MPRSPFQVLLMRSIFKMRLSPRKCSSGTCRYLRVIGLLWLSVNSRGTSFCPGRASRASATTFAVPRISQEIQQCGRSLLIRGTLRLLPRQTP